LRQKMEPSERKLGSGETTEGGSEGRARETKEGGSESREKRMVVMEGRWSFLSSPCPWRRQ